MNARCLQRIVNKLEKYASVKWLTVPNLAYFKHTLGDPPEDFISELGSGNPFRQQILSVMESTSINLTQGTILMPLLLFVIEV